MSSPVAQATTARPLEGKRIMLSRPRAQAGDFEARVRALGGEPVLAAAIAIVPPQTWTVVDAALRRIETYDAIAFTSVNAVHALTERADVIGVSRDAIRSRRLAAVGPTTAAAVSGALRAPDVVPTTHTAESLARDLTGVENSRVFFPCGDLAVDALPSGLRQRGAFVDEVVVYRTVPGEDVAVIVAALRAGAVDALLFTSASAVRFVADAVGVWPGGTVTACIGPTTADAARAAGFEPDVVAESASQNDLLDGVARWFAARRNGE
jgi:uroporphyrinogen-III synthase